MTDDTRQRFQGLCLQNSEGRVHMESQIRTQEESTHEAHSPVK